MDTRNYKDWAGYSTEIKDCAHCRHSYVLDGDEPMRCDLFFLFGTTMEVEAAAHCGQFMRKGVTHGQGE